MSEDAVSSHAGLVASVRVRRPRMTVEVDLSVPPGEVVALLGPNGSGKSTLLRALAGLVPLDGGHVALDGQVWDDGTSTLSPPRRHVGMVFQDHLLFPHLTALENVAFGLRARRTSRAHARQEAGRWLERVGLAEVSGVRPGGLSGGQAQRVALARALATRPRLLLLDEPLSALDAGTRLTVRSELSRHLADFTGATVLVTHDPLDAMVLGDRLVVVEDGRVVQEGIPSEVARAPRTDYVARLVGLNLLRGAATGHQVRLDDGGQLVLASPVGERSAVLVAFAPAAVSLHRRPPEGSARNHWPVRVAGLERHGDVVRVSLAGAPSVAADVTAAAVADLDLGTGGDLWAAVKATEISAYPA